ncbi:MAG: hypothetical protein LBC94_04765 [Desulfovibrio sp.]|jgi:hypothetical protein|nr:hypothetical protein [Desulfovibrio sp.]
MKYIFLRAFHPRRFGTILLCCLMLTCACVNPAQAQAKSQMIPSVLTTSHINLLPYLEYYLDESGEMDEKEISALHISQLFQSIDIKNLPRETGALWLRFTLAPLPEGIRSSPLFLDWGDSVPGLPTLKRKILPLPTAGKEPQVCLIRLDGMPGPWFAPVLRTAENIADNREMPSRSAGMLALAVVMLLCLLRCLAEKGQWRIWAAAYAGTALLQAFLGLPAVDHGRIEMNNLVAALAPGLALMLFSHVGRRLTGIHNRSLSIQFFLLSLPGAALALFPLVPDCAWITRYFEIWPLGTLLCAPSALFAVMAGIPCAGRFLLGCLLPPLFTAAGLLLAGSDIPTNLLASAPLWGTAISAMLIATTAAPAAEAAKLNRKNSGSRGDNVEHASGADIYNLEEPLGDPNLRLIPAHTDKERTIEEKELAHDRSDFLSQTLVEEAIRLPLERLMREGAALEHCALPPAVRQYVENMLSAGREMANVVSNPIETLQNPSPKPHTVFNLQHLMRNAHDCVAPTAKTTGIGLAWYMPPHLGHMYEGEAEELDGTLRMLLESAVRATRHGAVHFSVKRVPESADPGHLLFTIEDTGSGMPPHDRSSLALTRAWELAGSHNGFLGVECSPRGATIAFTLRMKCREDAIEENKDKALPHVIIAAESAVDRQLLSHILKSLPCKSSEARSLHEALLLHKADPAPLFILHGRFADATAPLLQQFTDVATAALLPFCKILGITRDDSRWDAMAQEGFTHALLEPVDSESFCITVREILDESIPADMTAKDRGTTADISDSEPTKSTENTQESAPQADTAQTQASPGEKDTPPAQDAQGRPPLPELFTADALSGQNTQIKIPTLTALPDLLSFAESLRLPANNSIGQTMSFMPSEPFNGLFSSTMPLPTDNVPTPKTTDKPLPDIFPPTETSPLAVRPPKPEIPSIRQEIKRPLADDKKTDGPPKIFLKAVDKDKPEETPAMTATVSVNGGKQPEASAESGDEVYSAPQEHERTPSSKMPQASEFVQKEQAPQHALAEKNELNRTIPVPAAASNAVTDAKPVTREHSPKSTFHSHQKIRKGESGGIGPVASQHSVQNLPDTPAGNAQGDVKEKRRPENPLPAKNSTVSSTGKGQGEWVGEPIPIVAEKTPSQPSLQGKLKIKNVLKEKKTAPKAAAFSHASASTPDHQANKEASPDVPKTADAAASTATKEQNASFMDFIADMDTSVRDETNIVKEVKEQFPVHVKAARDDNAANGEAKKNPAPAQKEGFEPKHQHQREADKTMQRLVERLDRAVNDAQNAFTQRRAAAVGEAAQRIAVESDNFGLRVLARMARCVERAARANDMNALKDLLPELTAAVERNRIALVQRS